MSRYIKKHKRQFAGVALPLFFLLVLGTYGISVFPGWLKPSFGGQLPFCTTQVMGTCSSITGSTLDALTVCDPCAGEACSFVNDTFQCVNTGSTFSCRSNLPECYDQCGTTLLQSATFCVNTTTCLPDDSFCQDLSGGNEPNACRVGTCTPGAASFNSGDPTGCDYDYPTSLCTNCDPTPIDEPDINCGNGVCEEAHGETFFTCDVDCVAPDFPEATPYVEGDPVLNDACDIFVPPPAVLFIPFSGNAPDGGTCEDGDICTTNVCTIIVGGPSTCDVEPADCNGTGIDFCCPTGCNPPPDGPGTCNVQLDPDCDDDCLPAEACVEPSPSASPLPPPGTPLRVFGSKPFCSLGDRGPTSGWQGALSLMSLALGIGLLGLWRKRAE